jgi:hypothetical protein
MEHAALEADRAKLRNSTTVFLVGNIEPTMEWYKQLGFTPVMDLNGHRLVFAQPVT